jgi:hypothetical protein
MSFSRSEGNGGCMKNDADTSGEEDFVAVANNLNDVAISAAIGR